ncbi:hypothetical protein E2C01_055359 [Portunus trituberculatus]|uniref:Uncharacterized protein n=1 Tax=Portunus trituberculatus TaxID=210409 RepID=A0A5B7GM84_PORTR|nr:hypothetical protein [Portunus trituberculatus]
MVCWLPVADSWEGLTWSCFPSSRLQPTYFRHQGRLSCIGMKMLQGVKGGHKSTKPHLMFTQ